MRGCAKKMLGLALIFLITGPLAATDMADMVKMLQAKYGKYEALIKDLTLSMDVTMQDGKNTMTTENVMYYKEPKFRLDSKMSMGQDGAMTTSVIFDGSDMWLVSMMGAQKLADKDQMKYQRERNWKWWSWLMKGGRVRKSR